MVGLAFILMSFNVFPSANYLGTSDGYITHSGDNDDGSVYLGTHDGSVTTYEDTSLLKDNRTSEVAPENITTADFKGGSAHNLPWSFKFSTIGNRTQSYFVKITYSIPW